MTKNKFDVTSFFAKQDVLDKGHVELIDGMVTDPLIKIVNSARVSFLKEVEELTKKDEKLIKFLYRHEHYSTFRHSYFSFRVKAPLFVFRQWWKYQIGSDWVENVNVGTIDIPETNWNEASGRYVEFEPEFHIPESIRIQSKDNKQGSHGKLEARLWSVSLADEVSEIEFFENACNQQYENYKQLVQAGAAKEQARMILPQNIYSECIWTCSLQTILYFLHQRTKPDAQKEIQEYANAVKDLMMPMLWVLFEGDEAK